MVSFNVILLFALFSLCAGVRILRRSPRTTTIINDGINYTHPNQEKTWMKAKNVYAFTVKDINGNDVRMTNFRGKILLIVNVASKCGLTGLNYKTLNELHSMYAERGLVILAFPCNQFLNQEPGTNEEIAAFAKEKKIKFPIFSKINVNGEGASPLWKYLKSSSANENIAFSFTKFVVDRNGKVIKRISPISNLKFDKIVESYFRPIYY